ncbi:MAG: hypothetical protein CMJ39_09545 [Phycisphaerae bacterium]|nr:hypothetical protein [Phycisphaerae bacterium]|tara:strand:+ start:83 stop:496 length:414 start_codon:yes stop_codon:yes gene_type:complete
MTSKLTSDEKLAVVQRCNTPFAAEALIILLADHDIPATSESKIAPLSTGKDGGANQLVSVLVRESQLDLARSTIENARSDAAKLDWEDIDVGERTDRVKIKGSSNRQPLWFRTVAILALLGIAGVIFMTIVGLIFNR